MAILHICVMAVMVLLGSPVWAVDISPSEEAIAEAIEHGKQDASSSKAATSNTIGNQELLCQGFGFLQTKLWNIREASKANEKKLRPTKREELNEYLASPSMLITFVYCASSHRKSDDHIVIRQGEKIIQPARVSTSIPELLTRTSYAHTVQANFAYSDFDPVASATVIVIPEKAERREYRINLIEYR